MLLTRSLLLCIGKGAVPSKDKYISIEGQKDIIEKAKEIGQKNKAKLFYQDETSFRLLPVLRKMWMKVGQQAKILTPNNWNRYFSVFGVLNPLNGETIFKIFDRKNGENFIKFLELLLKTYPIDIYLVVDRATYHRSEVVKEWLAKNIQIQLIYLPPKSPRLNPIEDIFSFSIAILPASRLSFISLTLASCLCNNPKYK